MYLYVSAYMCLYVCMCMHVHIWEDRCVGEIIMIWMMMVVVVMMMMMDCPTLHARPVAVLQDFTPSLHNRGTHARAPPPFSENETTTTTTSGCPRCLPFSRRLHCESFPMASTSSMKSPSCPTT
jgi:hypothetical protein